MSIRAFLVAALAFAAVSAVDKSDNVCYGLDSVIEDKVLSQIRKYLVNTSSDYVHLANYGLSLLGYGAGIYGGKVGDLSKFSLEVYDGFNSSQLCINKVSGEELITVYLKFDQIELTFDEFFIHLPFMGIGDCKTIFTFKGSELLAEVQLIKDEKDKKCIGTELVAFGLRHFGEVHIDFESGLLNKLYSFILNYFSDDIVSALSLLRIDSWIGSDAKVFLQPVVRQLESNICSLEPQTY